jgi:hypothetical protein
MEAYAPAMEKIFYESQKILEKNNLDILGVHSKFCEKTTFFVLRKKEKKKMSHTKNFFFLFWLAEFFIFTQHKKQNNLMSI